MAGERRACTRCGQPAFPHQHHCAHCGGELGPWVPSSQRPGADPGATGGAGAPAGAAGAAASGSAAGGDAAATEVGAARRLNPAIITALTIATLVVFAAGVFVVTRESRTRVSSGAPPLGVPGTIGTTVPGTTTPPGTQPRGTSVPPVPTTEPGGVKPLTVIVGRPILDHDRVVVLTGQGAAMINAIDGSTQWSTELCANPAWADPTQQTADGILVVRCDQRLYALDTATGAQAWRAVLSTGADNVRVGGGVIVSNDRQNAEAIGLADGQRRWMAPLTGPAIPRGTSVSSRVNLLEVNDEHAFVVLGSSLIALATADGSLTWSSAINTPWLHVTASQVITQADGGRVASWDASTGLTQWTTGDATLKGAVVAASTNGVLLASVKGVTVGLDPTDGHRLWSFDRTSAKPEDMVAGDGRLFLYGLPGCIILDAGTGAVLTETTDQGTQPSIGFGHYAFVSNMRQPIVRPLP